jgi:hypothetical protein
MTDFRPSANHTSTVIVYAAVRDDTNGVAFGHGWIDSMDGATTKHIPRKNIGALTAASGCRRTCRMGKAAAA